MSFTNKANKIRGYLFIVTLIAALLAGCTTGAAANESSRQQGVQQSGGSQSQATQPAAPDYGIDKLIIAYLPNESTEELAEVRGLMSDELSAYIGIPVESFNAADYNAVVEAMRTEKVHMAYFGPLTFVDASERAGAIPLAIVAPDRDKSLTGYQSHFIVRSDSPLESIKDLQGVTFAFVDPSSTSGNLVPTKEFLDAFPETTNEDLHANGRFFESVMFSGSHQNGLQAVLRGDVDAAPIASDILTREISAGNVTMDDIKIIHSSPTIPTSPMGIRADLPQELQDKILEFLLAYDDDEYFVMMMGQAEGQTLRYIPADDADYDYVRSLKAEVQ